MPPPGFVVLGIRRAFRARPGETLSSRELLAWTYPRGAGRPLRERCNHFRSIRRAASKMCVRPPISCRATRRASGTAGLADPKMKARLTDFGGTPLVCSPADFGKLIAEETEKWAKVVKFAGIKAI